MTKQIERKIAIKDYYGKGKHVYEDEMGFRDYPPTDTFYAIFNEVRPVEVYTMPHDRRRSDFVGWQCECDPHEEDQLIATFDDISEVWDGLKIDGKDFEEVINHSYIVALN